MKLNENNAKGASILIVVVVVVILALILFKDLRGSFKKILQSFGLEDSPEEKENSGIIDEATRNQKVSSAWNPNFWQQKAGSKIFTQAQTDSLVSMLWNSVGYVYDSPEKFVSAIKTCRYKSQVSWLAYNFNKKYSNDLLTWAAKKLDTDEQKFQLAVAIKYVNSLPTGF